MKRLAVAAGLGALLIAGLALALPDVDPWQAVQDLKVFMRPTRFEQEARFAFIDAGTTWQATDHSTTGQVDGVLTVGLGDAGALHVNGFGFSPTGRGTLIYDFPSIPATGANSGCQDSAAGTATGCAFGDLVLLGIDQTLPANKNAAPPIAYLSAASTFLIRVCNDSNDGGAIDWPDASFTVMCVR